MTEYKSKVKYEAPIEINIEEDFPDYGSMAVSEIENMICSAVLKVGITVDKEELIKALRYDRGQYEKGYADGKRDAIDRMEEALQAAEPTERQVVDYCHKRCLVVIEADLFHELKASYGKMPKRGEWEKEEIGKGIFKQIIYKCSICGRYLDFDGVNAGRGNANYCPCCGAKMEVQKGAIDG